MDKSLGEKINVYYQTLRDEKKPRADRMKEVAELLAPHRALNTDINDTPENEHLGEDIYDGNPLDAVRKMVDGLFGNSVGPTSKWMESVPNVDKYQYPQLDDWLRGADKSMMSILERSRFYKAIYQSIRDGVTLANSAVLTRVHGRSLSFKAINPFHYFFEEDDQENLMVFMYRFPLTALKAAKLYGDNLPQDVQDDLKNENYSQVRWYLYTVMERDSYNRFQGQTTKDKMPYQSAVKLLEGDNEIIKTGGYMECPVAVWQYYRESGEKWGRGPGDEAYYDVQYLNRLAQSALESAELRAAPPMQAPIEMKAQGIKYKPKAVNYYQSPERRIQFDQPGGDYFTAMDLLQRKDEVIGYHFMRDFWTMLSRSTKRKTAYEVSEEQSERLSLLSYAIQNFFREMVTPLLERSYGLSIRNELIPPVPEGIGEGVSLDFKYHGLLAQAQRRSVEGQGMLRALQEVMPALEINPEAGMAVDWEKFIRRRFEINNVEADMVRSEDEIKKIRQQMAEQQEMQRAQQMALEAGKAAKDTKMEDFTGGQQ